MEEREPTRRNSIPWVLHVTRWGGGNSDPSLSNWSQVFLILPVSPSSKEQLVGAQSSRTLQKYFKYS